MNKIYVVAFSSLLLVCAAQADHGKGGKHGGKHKDWLFNKLELTEEQKQSVTEILKEQRKKSREIKQSALEQVRPQLEALHGETREQLAEILTEEQLQSYDDLGRKRHERKQKRFERR